MPTLYVWANFHDSDCRRKELYFLSFSLFIVNTSVWCWMKNSDKQYFIRDLINRLKVLTPTSQVPHLNQYLSLYNHRLYVNENLEGWNLRLLQLYNIVIKSYIFHVIWWWYISLYHWMFLNCNHAKKRYKRELPGSQT